MYGNYEVEYQIIMDCTDNKDVSCENAYDFINVDIYTDIKTPETLVTHNLESIKNQRRWIKMTQLFQAANDLRLNVVYFKLSFFLNLIIFK